MGASTIHTDPDVGSALQCQNCGAPLASDQRYCLACGERRGKARFSASALAPAASETVTVQRRPPRNPRSSVLSSGLVLISFVGILLLAIGVGVLIGRANNQTPQKASSPSVQVVKVNGGGNSGNSGSSGNSGGSGTKVKRHKRAKQAAAAPLPKKVIVKASQAAAKVLGGTNLPPPTVTLGQKGSGPGFSGGKFTGDYFGNS